MKKFIMKHKELLIIFSLFLIITSYDNQEEIVTEKERFLKIKESLDRTEKKVIEIDNILKNK